MGSDIPAFLPSLTMKTKKPMPIGHGEKMYSPSKVKQHKTGRPYAQPSIAFHKGSFHYVQRVRITSSRAKPFVRHTTPHFDGTSREVSYSVRPYHTRRHRPCKPSFPILSILVKIDGKIPWQGRAQTDRTERGRLCWKFCSK